MTQVMTKSQRTQGLSMPKNAVATSISTELMAEADAELEICRHGIVNGLEKLSSLHTSCILEDILPHTIRASGVQKKLFDAEVKLQTKPVPVDRRLRRMLIEQCKCRDELATMLTRLVQWTEQTQ